MIYISSSSGSVLVNANQVAYREVVELSFSGDYAPTQYYVAPVSQDVDPTNKANSVALSEDGLFIVVGHDSSPYLTTYKYNPTFDQYIKMTNPDSLPAIDVYSLDLSNDGTYLTALTETHPFIYTYKYNSANNQYVLTSPPNTLPQYTGRCIRTSDDGLVMAVAAYNYSAPIEPVLLYTWNETNNRYEETRTFDTSLNSHVQSVALNADGSKLVVGYATSSPNPTLWSYTYNATTGVYDKDADPDVMPDQIVWGLDMTPDGQRLVSAHQTDDGISAYVWNETNNRYELVVNGFETVGDNQQATYDCAISDDYNFVAVGYQLAPFLRIFKWNTTTSKYELINTPDVELTAEVRGVDMTIDGQTVSAAYHSGTKLQTYRISVSS